MAKARTLKARAKDRRDLFGRTGPLHRRRDGEFAFQMSLVAFLRAVLPASAVVVHVPNGGPDKAWRGKAAALGAMPGAPDLFIFWNGRAFGIECKSTVGERSPVQIDAHLALQRAGIKVATVRTLETAELYLKQFGIPLRGKIAA